MSLGDYIFKSLPYRMQGDIAYGNYMNAEADINRLQMLNQNLASYREALQDAQKAKFVAGEEYLAAINAQRAKAGQEPFTGWPEEAMGTRRVMPAVDRMGAPLTPDEEDQYRHTPPRRAYPVSRDEQMQAQDVGVLSQPADQLGKLRYQIAEKPEPEQPVAQPEQKAQQEEKQPDFVKVSNQKPKQEPTPLEMIADLESKGQVGEAHEMRYRLEKAAYDRNMAKINAVFMQIAQSDPEQAATFRKTYKEIAEEKFKTKPIEETPQYKQATEVASSNQYLKSGLLLASLKNVLEEAQLKTDKGENVTKVANFLAAQVPKALLSIATPGSTEAMQVEEVYRYMPELRTIFGAGFNLNDWARIATNRTGLLGPFYKDPQAFIDKSKDLYSVGIKTHNALTDQYSRMIGSRATATSGLFKLSEIGKRDASSPTNLRQRYFASKGMPVQFSPTIIPAAGAPQERQVPAKSAIGNATGTVTSSFGWPVLMGD